MGTFFGKAAHPRQPRTSRRMFLSLLISQKEIKCILNLPRRYQHVIVICHVLGNSFCMTNCNTTYLQYLQVSYACRRVFRNLIFGFFPCLDTHHVCLQRSYLQKCKVIGALIKKMETAMTVQTLLTQTGFLLLEIPTRKSCWKGNQLAASGQRVFLFLPLLNLITYDYWL